MTLIFSVWSAGKQCPGRAGHADTLLGALLTHSEQLAADIVPTSGTWEGLSEEC